MSLWGLPFPAGPHPALTQDVSQLLHVEYRTQGPPTVWIRGSTFPAACHRSTLASSAERKAGRVSRTPLAHPPFLAAPFLVQIMSPDNPW